MKHSLIALSILAALPFAASANDTNVTLYGVADGGLAYTNKSPTASGSGSLLGFQANGESPSIFGLKGSEDIGNGMKVNFDLEGHYLTSTGQGEQWGGLFGRQANVGISDGSAGTLTLGTQYSQAVLAFAATDPRGLKESFSGLMYWAFSQNVGTGGVNGGSANSTSVIDVFVKNAVSYTNKIDDVSIGVSYSFGGIAGSQSAASTTALGLVYSGPVTVDFAYQSDNGPGGTYTSSSMSQKISGGVGYKYEQFSFKANYLQAKNKDATTGNEINNIKVWGLGVDFHAAANDTITLAYYNGKDSDVSSNTNRSVILSNDYALSKRTTLYALLAQNNAGSGATGGTSAYNGDNFAAPPVAGQNSFAAQLGIKHAF